MNKKFIHRCCDFLWDAWCAISIVGIWPRWIEPKLLQTTRMKMQLDPRLNGLKIALFSDLHLNHKTSESLLNKISARINNFHPDLVLFAGDFLCHSTLDCEERLQKFLNTFKAPLGCYAVLGNHDYSDTAGLNANGEYDVMSERKNESFFLAGMQRLFNPIAPIGVHHPRLSKISLHESLRSLLQKTPFKLLVNESVSCEYRGAKLNVTGLGEYTMNHTLPAQAFENYAPDAKGIVMAHNPDAIRLLMPFPGDLIVSGHTHGGQVNLPWVWKKLTVMENRKWKSGFFEENDKKVYVTRGVGSVFTFRWFSPPEIVLVTVEE